MADHPAYTEDDAETLSGVLANAYARGIRAGTATLARALLDAGYRRVAPAVAPPAEAPHRIIETVPPLVEVGIGRSPATGQPVAMVTDPDTGEARYLVDLFAELTALRAEAGLTGPMCRVVDAALVWRRSQSSSASWVHAVDRALSGAVDAMLATTNGGNHA